MATSGTTAAEPESSQQDDIGASQIVVVDLDEAQPSRLVKLLRKGRGKLMTRVERIARLTEADAWNYRPLSVVTTRRSNKERRRGFQSGGRGLSAKQKWQDGFRVTTLSAARKLRGT